MREYLAVTDVHAPDKLRCNRVLQTLPEFYTTYGIQPGDGMSTGAGDARERLVTKRPKSSPSLAPAYFSAKRQNIFLDKSTQPVLP